MQWPRFHAGQRAGTLPAGGAGSAGAPPVEGPGISSGSESVSASPCGGSPSPSLSPSALMTSCAASSVGDRGRVLRRAAGSAIVVLLCLRAGGGVRMSRGWRARGCVGALLVVGVAEGRPRGGCLPSLCEGRLALGAVPPLTARLLGGLLGSATVPLACMPCGGCMSRGWWGAVPGGGGLPPL